jgi:hypothetical protein
MLNSGEPELTKVIYEVVEHDGGWAYKVGDVLSEPFPTHAAAHDAAAKAAERQRHAGQTDGIEYEDKAGHWHQEVSQGTDRPDTEVDD